MKFDKDIRNKRIFPLSGSRRGGDVVPVERKDLKDFFPRTKKYLPDRIKEDVFKEHLSNIIREVLGDIKHLIEVEDNELKIQATYHSNLKPMILMHVEREEWHTIDDLGMTEQLIDSRNKYFMAAGTELGSYVAGLVSPFKGKGIPSLSVKYGNITILKADITNSHFIKRTREFIEKKYLGSNNRDSAKKNANRKYYPVQNYQYYNGGVPVSKSSDNPPMDVVIREGGTLIHQGGQTTINYDVEQQQNPIVEATKSPSRVNLKFEALDCMKGLGSFEEVGKIGASISPHLGLASTFVNVVGNTALGITYNLAARRSREIEEEGVRANKLFNDEIRQSIKADIEGLEDVEIMDLVMNHLGII